MSCFPQSFLGTELPPKRISKRFCPPNSGMVSTYVIEETRKVISRKFPNDVWQLDLFLTEARGLRVVKTPEESVPEEDLVHDSADHPIVRAAVSFGADVLLTGDKDLLESGITKPRIMSPAEFLKQQFQG